MLGQVGTKGGPLKTENMGSDSEMQPVRILIQGPEPSLGGPRVTARSVQAPRLALPHGTIWPQLETFGVWPQLETFGVVTTWGRRGAISILWVEAREAAKHPTTSRGPPHSGELPHPSC